MLFKSKKTPKPAAVIVDQEAKRNSEIVEDILDVSQALLDPRKMPDLAAGPCVFASDGISF